MGTEVKKGSNYAWAIAVACVAFYAVPLGFVANQAGLFATPVMQEFGWDRTSTTLYMSIQPWVAAICTPIAGKLITKYNPRWIMTAAAAVFSLSSLACAWFTQPWQWHIYGILYGASAAFWMYIATPTFVNRWFAKSNGTVIGVIGVFVSLIGAIMSPIIQSWITAYGWQTARIIISIIALILSVGLTAALLRESPEKCGVLPWGYSDEPEDKKEDKSQTKSVIDVANDEGIMANVARRSPAMWLLILMAGFFVISAAFVQQLSSYASTGALGAAVGAAAVSTAMITSMLGKFGLGWLCDHIGARGAGVVAGLFGLAGAAIAYASGANVTGFLVGVGLYGIGYSALTIVPPMTCRQAFGNKDYANNYSMVATGLNVFAGFSALIYARIFDITGSFAGCFWMIMIFYAIIIVLSLVIVPMGYKLWGKKAA